MESLDNPLEKIDEILKHVSENDIVIVDFHAETTSEKRAMGFYLDGKVSAVFGTHTHVMTADESVLKNGTGYITDLGMTGPINSVLGIKPEIIIKKLKEKMPIKFEYGEGDCKMECVLFDIDLHTRKTVGIKRLIIT